ncbi:MAG: cobalamin-dependent protein, partial [Pseudomonadota bacterium]|nr:cobalamin-dependent protein [Pseudomonadota bacterium]
MKESIFVINPGGRDQIYQNLGNELTAIEPPLWTRIIAGYLLDRLDNVSILDTEAEHIGTLRAAEHVVAQKPTLVVIPCFGHQPSASTQSMVAASALIDEIKKLDAGIPCLLLGGHVSALPEETLQLTNADFVCQGEGTITSFELFEHLCGRMTLSDVRGLVYRGDANSPVFGPKAPISEDLDTELHGNVWHLLPMEKYRAHNWQCFGELSSRQPYASIYTSLGCPYKCVFCCINAPFDSTRYRLRSPQAVVDEVTLLYNEYGV